MHTTSYEFNLYHYKTVFKLNEVYSACLHTGDVDYDSSPLTITAPAGATMVEVCIPIIVDDVDEDLEMFYLSLVLETFTPRNVTLGPNSFVNAFIVD